MVIPPAATKLGRLNWDKLVRDLSAQRPMIIPTEPQGEVEIKWLLKQPSSEAIQLAELVGRQEVGESLDSPTDHAWLVGLGHFAPGLGLVVGLEQVPLEQRKGPDETIPQTKLMEFLVGILGGIEALQELNEGGQPLTQDRTMAEAWVQAIFRHYSQVGRTLEVADEATLAAVVAVLRMVSEPFIQAAVMEEIKQKGPLTIDVDLTGDVSPTSTDYPQADLGGMADEVSQGYQAAVTCLVSERGRRLRWTWQRYAGRTLSADCLQAAVSEVEELVQVRPRRRVELVQARRPEMVVQIDPRQAQLDGNQPEQSRVGAGMRE